MTAQKNGQAEEQEPSMEEILSSIKRIIADDEEPAADSDSAEISTKVDDGKATETDDGEDEDVLELTEVVADDKKNGKGSKKSADNPEAEASATETAPNAAPATKEGDALADEIAFEADFEDEDSPVESGKPLNGKGNSGMDETAANGLLSEKTASASTNAFSKITKAVQGPGGEDRVAPDATTVEAFVADLLRPSLKEWLEGNLERIVETVVEQEVKKLARRAELL